jgi:hypothetical protein
MQVVSVEPLLMFPLTRSFDPNWFTRSVNVGAGAGLYVFYGDGFDTAWRPAIQDSARLYVLSMLPVENPRRWRIVRVEYTPKIPFTSLSDERLGVPNRVPSYEAFDQRAELNGGSRLRIAFDFSVFQ